MLSFDLEEGEAREVGLPIAGCGEGAGSAESPVLDETDGADRLVRALRTSEPGQAKELGVWCECVVDLEVALDAGCGASRATLLTKAVSYTHLTLPTICSV